MGNEKNVREQLLACVKFDQKHHGCIDARQSSDGLAISAWLFLEVSTDMQTFEESRWTVARQSSNGLASITFTTSKYCQVALISMAPLKSLCFKIKSVTFSVTCVLELISFDFQKEIMMKSKLKLSLFNLYSKKNARKTENDYVPVTQYFIGQAVPIYYISQSENQKWTQAKMEDITYWLSWLTVIT